MHKWMEKVPVSEALDQVVENSLNQLKFEQKRQRRRRWTAASGVTGSGFCRGCCFLWNPSGSGQQTSIYWSFV